MNVVELILELGRWGQTHQTAVLSGVLATPVLLRWPESGAPGPAGRPRRTGPRGGRRRGKSARPGSWPRMAWCSGGTGGGSSADDSETHILLVAPTRSGKGVGIIIPTLLTWRPSALVLDPKDGENYDVTAPWRARVAGNQIAYFTPCRTPHTCVNVLDTIRVGKPSEVGDTQIVSHSLVSPQKMARESSTSLHFRELAALVLTASILHVKYTVRGASLARVWYFLTQQHPTLHACLKTLTDDGASQRRGAPGHCGPHDGAQ